ncbi:hypothetical protein [Aliamphritea spongicola]|nr:hypothetical protein [Aliamphritea spongicola]
MLEEIILFTLRSVFYLIFSILIDFLFYVVFYYIGLPVCLLFTLGRYPPHSVGDKSVTESFSNPNDPRHTVAVVGMTFTIVLVIVVSFT